MVCQNFVSSSLIVFSHTPVNLYPYWHWLIVFRASIMTAWMEMLAYVNRNVLPMIGLSILHWIAWLVFAKPFMLYRRHYTVSLLRAHTKRLLVMGWTRPTQTRPWAGYGPRCGPIHLNGPCGGEATAHPRRDFTPAALLLVAGGICGARASSSSPAKWPHRHRAPASDRVRERARGGEIWC